MTDTLDSAKLPGQFMVVDYPYMPPRVILFQRVINNSWNVYVVGGERWDFYDNVGNYAALAAFNTREVYVKVTHD